jgi:hypothetical protein
MAAAAAAACCLLLAQGETLLPAVLLGLLPVSAALLLQWGRCLLLATARQKTTELKVLMRFL